EAGRPDAKAQGLAHEAQYEGTPARLDRMLHGPFRGSRAGELQEHAAEVLRRPNLEELLREVNHRKVRIHEEDQEAVPLERVDGRLQDLRVDVPEVVRCPLTREVDVLLAFDVVRSEEHTSELQSPD